MKKNKINILIGGEAGQGIIVSSLTLAKVFTRGGLYAFILNEYPNTIKGLHNWCSIRVDCNPLTSHTNHIDLVIALNKDTILQHKEAFQPGCGLIYDPDDAAPGEILANSEQLKLYPLPLNQIIKSLNAEKLMRNSTTIGATLALVSYDFDMLVNLLKELFERKGEKVVKQNLDVAKAGFDYIKENFADDFEINIEKQKSAPLMIMSGNDATSMGAIKAGAKLLCAYPMTPTSNIIHYVAAKQIDYNYVVKHTEDEIAAINMAIGANYVGVRSFVCTSGGGFSLMVEALGLAGISETPLVCIVGQRPGPATGQPTHTSQGDLKFLINASQGEFPRIAIAPGDNQDCFYETFNAFNLAEKFQTPVLVISDKYLGESYRSCHKFDTSQLKIERGKLMDQAELDQIADYCRYEFTDDGISPRAVPGQTNGIHKASSYEHEEHGFYDETPSGVSMMLDKRMKKVELMREILPEPKLFGAKEAEFTIISWGSTKGVILEAIELLKTEGVNVNFYQVIYIHPFPADYIAEVLNTANKTIVIENNQTGQLAALVREYTGTEVDFKLLKYDGQPFYPSDIHEYIKDLTPNG